MEEQKKNPELRFAGFTDDWREENLGLLAEFTKGQGYSKNDLKATGSPIILYGRLYTNYQTVIDEVDTYADAQENSYYSSGGEVIVPASGETQEDIVRASVVTKPDIILGGDLNVIKPKESIDSDFLAITISNGRVYKELVKKAQGKSVVHIRNSDLKEANIPYPRKIEQQQIGSFFKNIDELISKHQKKHNRLVTLKKSMLEKMFPKEGQSVPEIRFKGFEGDWKKCEFQEIATLKRGLTYSPSNLRKTGTRVLRSSNIFESRFINRIDDVFVDDTAINIDYVKEGDILITAANGSSKLVGKHALITGIKGKVVHGGFMLLASSNVPLFLNASMSSSWYKKFVNLYTAGGGGSIGNLSKSDLDQQRIYIPADENEQLKIGKYFQNIDTLITNHLEQLKKLKNFKQSLSEKMFV